MFSLEIKHDAIYFRLKFIYRFNVSIIEHKSGWASRSNSIAFLSTVTCISTNVRTIIRWRAAITFGLYRILIFQVCKSVHSFPFFSFVFFHSFRIWEHMKCGQEMRIDCHPLNFRKMQTNLVKNKCIRHHKTRKHTK